jgi:hypothetical protein
MVILSATIPRGSGRLLVLKLIVTERGVFTDAYTAAAGPGTCRVCGCTDERACPPTCAWADVEHTLCSRCWAVQRGA